MANTLPIADKQTLDAVKAILEEQATLIAKIAGIETVTNGIQSKVNNAFYVPSSTQRLSATAERSTSGNLGIAIKSFLFTKSGKVRISFDAKYSNTEYPKTFEFRVNDQLTSSVTVNSTDYKTYTVDVPVFPGKLEIWVNAGSSNATVYIKNVYVYYDYGSTDSYVITN